MDQFLTLEGAWEEFKKQSDILAVTDGDPDQLMAAKDLFFAGCQGALFAFAHIKEHCESDGPRAVPYIMAMYNEAHAYVDAANKRAEEYDRQQAEKVRAAWPFPTGAKH